MSSKVEFKWTKIEQNAFDENKRVLSQGNLLDYGYFNEALKINTDASNFKLGAVIIQKGKPITL